MVSYYYRKKSSSNWSSCSKRMHDVISKNEKYEVLIVQPISPEDIFQIDMGMNEWRDVDREEFEDMKALGYQGRIVNIKRTDQ